jgi:ribosome-binding factor A
MRFTPDLRFRHDESFAAAERLNRLLDDPRVRADVYVSPFEGDDKEDGPQPARGAAGSGEEP